jgi:hypothetical protein
MFKHKEGDDSDNEDDDHQQQQQQQQQKQEKAPEWVQFWTRAVTEVRLVLHAADTYFAALPS